MAQSGYTPILIYGSGTATNVPLAANLTSTANGAELALNYADGKLYYKNSAGTVTLLADKISVSVASANGFAGSVSQATATSTPAITISTTVTGVLKGNGTAISAAVSGTDIKTVNSNSLLGSGNIAVGTVTSVAASAGTGISVSGSPITSSGTLTITNTGVTSLTAGSGISLSGSTGAVTVSATSSGGMTLISTVSVPGGSSGVSVTGISSYKSIIITTVSVSLTASQRITAALSTDNGASYSSAVQFTEYASPTYGFIQFFNTNTGADKPYLQVDRTGQNTNYVTVPSAGAVNAIQLSIGGLGSFFSSGTILIYGMN